MSPLLFDPLRHMGLDIDTFVAVAEAEAVVVEAEAVVAEVEAVVAEVAEVVHLFVVDYMLVVTMY